jgi:hypothetical protein
MSGFLCRKYSKMFASLLKQTCPLKMFEFWGWCREKKYELTDEKFKSISFSRGSKPEMFQYVIGGKDLERVDVINDLGV